LYSYYTKGDLKMNKNVKKFLRSINNFLFNIGIDSRRIFALQYYWKYRVQCKEFLKLGGVITHKSATLIDYYDNAGSASGHYFHQDLLVASFIFKKNPSRHIDIASRIDGFVAHVASFRKIDVMDVRDLNELATGI